MKCPECGWENNPKNRFCETCGSPLQFGQSDEDQESLLNEPTIVSGNPSFQKKIVSSSSVKCPQCQTLNPLKAPYCSSCGTPLNSSLPSMNSGSLKEMPRPDINYTSDSSLSSNSNRSKFGNRGIIIGIALLCGVLLIGGVTLWWVNNNSSQDSKIARSDPSTSQSFIIISSEYSSLWSYSESRENSYSDESYIESASRTIRLDVNLENSLGSNYSGASCAVMALELQNIDASQSSIGKELGLDQGNITSYDDLTKLLNSKISRSGSDNLYSNFYMVTDYMSSEDMMNTYTVFLKQIDQALREGRAPLVVIGESPDGKLKQNFYGLISGKTSEDTYFIVIPYVDGAQTYEVDPQTLANMITAPEVFCYLY